MNCKNRWVGRRKNKENPSDLRIDYCCFLSWIGLYPIYTRLRCTHSDVASKMHAASWLRLMKNVERSNVSVALFAVALPCAYYKPLMPFPLFVLMHCLDLVSHLHPSFLYYLQWFLSS